MKTNVVFEQGEGFNGLSTITVTTPVQVRKSPDGKLYATLEAFGGITTYGENEFDLNVAINEAVSGFFKIADKYGKGIKEELKLLGFNINEEVINDDLSKYIESIKVVSESKSDLIFNNSNPEQARIVLTQMFSHANKEICFFINDLSEYFFGNYDTLLVAITRFAINKKTFKMVIDCAADNLTTYNIYKALSALKKDYPDYIDIRKSNMEFKDSIMKISNNARLNFAVTDNKAFRIEEYEGGNNKRGLSCFNDRKVSSKIKKAFDSKFHTCNDFFI